MEELASLAGNWGYPTSIRSARAAYASCPTPAVSSASSAPCS